MGELTDAVAREGVRSVERIVPGDPIPYEGPLAKPQARTRRVMARVLQYLAEHERPDDPSPSSRGTCCSASLASRPDVCATCSTRLCGAGTCE